MIVDRYLAKEVFYTLLGVTLVLMLISVSVRLVGLFGKVASGVLQVDTVLILLGLKSISTLVFILPLALYLAILLAFSRLHRDSEMTALAAGGMGPAFALRPVMALAVVFAIVAGAISLLFAPWAEGISRGMMKQMETASDLKGITAGRFKEISKGVGVMYVEELNEDKTVLQHVFVQKLQDGKQSIISSLSGYQYTDEKTGDRFMVLENGTRYEGNPGDENYTIINFKKHGVRIREQGAFAVTQHGRATPTKELWGSKNSYEIAELQWRISAILFCFTLSFLAIPLSRTSQRQGRYSKLALALLIYIIYTNLINVARAWLNKGEISPLIGLWWVHGLMMVLAIVLLLQQSGVRHLFSKVKRTRAEVDAAR